MYEDSNGTYRIGINWKDIIVKIILVILFIILLLWLFPRNDLGVFYDGVYTNNINTMRDAAEKYYTGNRLPSNVGEAKVMTLKEMIDNKMIIRFTDKDKNYCDENASNVQVTKNATNDYVLKVHLVCGKDDDYILETLTGNGSSNGSSNGTSADATNNGTESNKVKESGDKTANASDSDNTESGSSTGKVAANSSDDMDVDYSRCSVKDIDTGNTASCAIYKTSVVLYQYKKAVYYTKSDCSCPAGYIDNGSSCVKVTKGATIPATPIYSGGRTITVDAKINSGEEVIEYADPIKVKVGQDKKCLEGYTPNGDYCIKYTKAESTTGQSSKKCDESEGYKLTNGVCIKKYEATFNPAADKYSCPNGGDLKGTNCVVTKEATPSLDVACPSGYTQNGDSCYKLVEAQEKTTMTCPNGGDLDANNKCVVGGTKTIDATPTTEPYCTTGTLSGNKCVISETISATPTEEPYCTTGTLSGNKCVISQKVTSGVEYYCTRGTQKNDKCEVITNATPSSVPYCTTGTLSGSKCNVIETKNATPSQVPYCTTGTLSGNKCVSTSKTGATPYTSYSGWSCRTVYERSSSNAYTHDTEKKEYAGAISGASCGSPCGGTGIWYKYNYCTRSKYTDYRCPGGYDRSGSTCTKTNSTGAQYKTVYNCPSGYKLVNGNKCTRTVSNNAQKKTVYNCPSGSDKVNTNQCKTLIDAYRRTATTCPSGYQQSNGNCIKETTVSKKTVYKCPSGYSLVNGNKCTRNVDKEPSKKTVYKCPSSYTLVNGNKCTTGATAVYDAVPKTTFTCPEGVLVDGNKCKITTPANKQTKYNCPDGYTLVNGNKCTWTYVAHKEEGKGSYECSNAEDVLNLDEKTCTSTKEPTTVEGEEILSCSNGTDPIDGQCVDKKPAIPVDIYKLTCPEGYNPMGEGENMKCYRTVKREGTHYCELSTDILSGDKCIRNEEGSVIGSKCPEGYKQTEDGCYRETTDSTPKVCRSKTTTTYKYGWFENAPAGWEATGRTKIEYKNYTASQR